MADLNTIYDGVVEYFDPLADSGVPNFNGNIFGWGGTNKWMKEMPFWPQLEKINNDSVSTIAAVKSAFVTGSNREQWLYDRITAIDARAKFIYGRVSSQIDYLKSIGSDAYILVEKAFTKALSALPVIGGVIAGAEAGAEAARKLDAYKAQSLIQQYTGDIEQLGGIRKQLAAEYEKSGNVPIVLGPTEPGNDAANPNAVYYYYAGGVLLVLVFIIWLKRKRK